MTRTAAAQTADLPLADWARTMKRSVLRQMIAVVSRPGVLSFAGGLPASDLFPNAEYAQALAHVLTHDPRALQYGPPYPPLKAHIAALMAQRGVACDSEDIFITTGAQQGLNVLAQMLLNRGGQVLLEEIVYTGIQQVVAPMQPHLLTVPTDLRTGMDVDAVAALLARGARPAFIYVIPEAHNPLGVSLSLEKRHQLVDLARRYRVPIVEDDAYGFLIYGQPGGERRVLPPLRALEPDWVFYVGSFSKIMAPALRLGWMVAPPALTPKLTVVKEAGDLETSALTQRAVSRYLDEGWLPAHVAHLRQAYQERRDVMLAALEAYFPGEARWTRPNAGMFIWVEFPRDIDCVRLLDTAVTEEKVAYIPGHAFAAPGIDAGHCLRLSFSNCPPDQIEDGIRRLARILA
ncbi:MAG: PLP-dependent aminotransferase family protein [Ardenticatenales bacterium]|nr:PLP-dependent aminotransferase family protein [Ardenticatenales bacterium]